MFVFGSGIVRGKEYIHCSGIRGCYSFSPRVICSDTPEDSTDESGVDSSLIRVPGYENTKLIYKQLEPLDQLSGSTVQVNRPINL